MNYPDTLTLLYSDLRVLLLIFLFSIAIACLVFLGAILGPSIIRRSRRPKPPFDIGQRVLCVRTLYHHVAGENYTIREMFLSKDDDYWFVRLKEVPVSTPASCFVAFDKSPNEDRILGKDQ